MLRKILTSAIVLLITAGTAFAQSGTVEGTITDQQSGEAIVGANVFIQSVNKGSATDENGQFTISDVPYGTYDLRISYVGYDTKTVSVVVDQSAVTVDAELTMGASELGDVVVTAAYGISESKRSTDYQTTQVSADDISAVPSTSPADGLTGKVAGLQVNTTGGDIKPDKSIRLRGLRSITRDNAPLVVIDGTKASQDAFRDLNDQDIENINVLKGATSAALYGSDASNGALIVTTKSGANEELTVGLKSTTTWKNVAVMPDFQTKFGQGIDGAYNPYENTNWGPRFDGQMRRIGPDFPAGYPLDNQMVSYKYREDNLKDFYKTSADIKNSLYMSGGGETGSFYLSVGQNKKTGLVPHDEYETYSFTANGSKQLGDVKLGVNANYFSDDKNVVGDEIGEQGRPLKWHIINTPNNIPLTRYKDYEDPKSYANPSNYYNRYYYNPYWAIGTHRDKDNTKRLRGNINASWDVVDNINITGRIGINSMNVNGKSYRKRQDYNSALQPTKEFQPANVTDNETQSKTINGNLVAEGDFDLTDEIGLNAVLGSSVEMYNYRHSEITANNLSIPDFFDVSNGTGAPVVDVNEKKSRTFGFFGKVKFNYNEWVYLNATGRQDFTSTLPTDDNTYFYPSFGVSVILSDAIPALQDVSWLSMLKVTANNSTVYTDLDPYETTETFSQSSSFPLGSTNGFYLTNTTIDPNIKKEKLNSTEFGLNAAFFGGRMNFDASYYFTKTNDLITNVAPSYASGATGYLTNIGKLSGNGIEFTLAGDVIQSRSFNWNVSFNYSHYEQKVDEIQPGKDEISIEARNQFAIEGEVFPKLKTLSYQRDDQGRVIVDPETGVPEAGEVEEQGQVTPKHVLGLTTNFNYKGVSLSATMDYRTGHKYYALGIDAMNFTGRPVETAASNRQPFVFPNSAYKNTDGDYVANNNIPVSGDRSFWTDQWNNIAENYIRDARAFKLRNVAINYNLPAELLSSTVVSKVSVGVVGRNLLTILPNNQSRFSDPEFNDGGYFSAQPTRSYGFNVNVEF